MQELEHGEAYRYWGLMKMKVYTRRLRMELKSKLSSKNKFTKIRALAVPVLRCAVGMFNWRFKGIKNLQKN
jgi:hypothetical protein